MSKSIPDWEYEAEYYEALLHLGQAGFKIITDPVKGKGLFATKQFLSGETVLRERALCCSQNLDDFKAGVPVCLHCLASLEAPRDVVKRTAGNAAAAMLPKPPRGYAPPHREPCRNGSKGCAALFCSPRCEADAWDAHHQVLCTATKSAEQIRALNSFLGESWVQDGVDFSDTHFLGLRFFAFATSRHRAKRMPLKYAYAPIAQLIRAPLEKFHFTYLLAEEYEKDVMKLAGETPAAARSRRWEHFTKHRSDQNNDPISQYGRNGGSRTKRAMLEQGVQLMSVMFGWSSDEVEFFSPERWSELLGAVLLNGQERSPNSEYVVFQELLRQEDKGALSTFHKKVRAKGIQPQTFHSSSHGQGIYPVGACFNHSCEPNIQVSYVDDNNETLQVSALRQIEAGEELCISYIDEDGPVEERQQQLFEHYLFSCGCHKCAKDLASLRGHA